MISHDRENYLQIASTYQLSLSVQILGKAAFKSRHCVSAECKPNNIDLWDPDHINAYTSAKC